MIVRPDEAQDVEPVHIGHVEVQDHHVYRRDGQRLDPFKAGRSLRERGAWQRTERGPDHPANRRRVIDDQNCVHTLTIVRWNGRLATRDRKAHGEHRATARSLTAGSNRAAMQFHKMLRDRQSQTETRGCACRRRILLAESLKHVRQKRG
jgi:hypothetical protein